MAIAVQNQSINISKKIKATEGIKKPPLQNCYLLIKGQTFFTVMNPNQTLDLFQIKESHNKIRDHKSLHKQNAGRTEQNQNRAELI
ncbi:hypothetical protein SLEP1_g24658 [Rubroshorea leprosula]|uniref:Uncharacterized protein n=1 Tax=Rubroshorea leprosula TaxID=152421 RepID=A0AAV5JQW1_9ROSI|nr:hypothetical protein SLEP1_g24658 [Rubroshorea leprosula]